MAELGKIEKPEASSFKEERKLYLVPLLFPAREPPALKKQEEERSVEEKEEVKFYSQYGQNNK